MTKKNNKNKKTSVKSDNDKPKKNITLLLINKKQETDKIKENEEKKLKEKKEDDINDKKDKKSKKDKDKQEDKQEDYNNEDYNDEDYNDEDYNDQDYNDEDYNDEDYNDEDYNDEDYYDDDYDDEDEYEDNIFSSKNKRKKDLIIEDDDDGDDNEDENEDEDREEGEIVEDKNNRKRKPDETLDNLFSVIIGGKGMFGPRPPGVRRSFLLPDKELDAKRKNKKQKKEGFYDYFKESKELLPINQEINTLDDLIKLGETYDKKDKKRYVINMKALHKCLKPLKELNNFIGMKKIKEMILDLIFLRLQNIETKSENEMWHLVVQGSPGCGKTEVSRVIGRLYYGLGIVDKDEFTQVKRSQLIGKWCGHTAAQTQEIFDKAEGGVIFIDEAYSLGNPEQKDSFTKECIDTINQNLTEKKRTVVIIAGYKDQLDESFFSYNPGLARRFKMRLSVDNYDHEELRKIYLKKLYENDWEIMNNDVDKEIPLDFFEKNREIFKFNGGDMENLWSLTKVVHCRRIFGKDNKLTKKITKEDVFKAFEKYKENEEVSNRDDDKALKKYIQNTMYC